MSYFVHYLQCPDVCFVRPPMATFCGDFNKGQHINSKMFNTDQYSLQSNCKHVIFLFLLTALVRLFV